ncbi:MAG: CDP-alcohol phosphatidyltransferase family protein [Candidatus Bipolaricaulia bacterium]
MTLANIVTLVRLGLIPPLLFFLSSSATVTAFILFLLFLLGDLADGALARARREITPFGEFLDPLADKLLTAGLLVAFAALGRLSWLPFILLAIPQLGLLSGAIFLARRGEKVLSARPLGKGAAAVLALGLALAFFQLRGSGELIYLGIFLSYLAGLDYLRLILRARGGTPPVAGQ